MIDNSVYSRCTPPPYPTPSPPRFRQKGVTNTRVKRKRAGPSSQKKFSIRTCPHPFHWVKFYIFNSKRFSQKKKILVKFLSHIQIFIRNNALKSLIYV
jgi:hypothetical protein